MATKIVNLTEARIAVFAPYNPQVVKQFHDLAGRWGEVRLPTGVEKAWILDASHRERAEAVLAEFWPSNNVKVERVFTFDSTVVEPTLYAPANTAPAIDGLELCKLDRDAVGRIAHPDLLEVIENHLRPGGSRNHPTIGGRLVVRARVRSEATAKWVVGGVNCVTVTDVVPAVRTPVDDVFDAIARLSDEQRVDLFGRLGVR